MNITRLEYESSRLKENVFICSSQRPFSVLYLVYYKNITKNMYRHYPCAQVGGFKRQKKNKLQRSQVSNRIAY